MMAKVAYNNFLGHPLITIYAVKCIYAVYLHINKKNPCIATKGIEH